MTIEHGVTIPQEAGAVIHGDLALPDPVAGLVIFAHGSGSGRHSPRNRMVAQRLQERGLGTLLIDLLTEAEERVDLATRHLRFDIDLLAGRLAATARWAAEQPATDDLALGYFGASTGAAAALVAAARQPARIAAVVSRGGRPDLAGAELPHVQAPTLLIVGGADEVVIGMNEEAQRRMEVDRRLDVIPGATHLFEEPGALEEVARLAGDWFAHHFAARTIPGGR